MTLYTFNATVPAANDNPSDDQNPMLINNMSTVGIIGTDHITFNLNNGGQHTAITFNQDGGGQAYVPIPPVMPPKLFTNTQDGKGTNLPNGVAQLFYYSGNTDQSNSQYISSANGSAFLFGGMVLKWGNSGTIGSPVRFSSPFPQACFSVIITGTSSLYTGGFVVTSINQTNFTVTRTSGSLPTGYYYIAIGN